MPTYMRQRSDGKWEAAPPGVKTDYELVCECRSGVPLFTVSPPPAPPPTLDEHIACLSVPQALFAAMLF